MELNTIHQGAALEFLRNVPDQFVNCCITSPPYWGLRDYKVEPTDWPEIQYATLGGTVHVPPMRCCLGLEKKPEHFIGHLVSVFREVMRVLKDDGTVWLNIGDSYAANGKDKTPEQAAAKSGLSGGTATQAAGGRQQSKIVSGLKAKDLVGIPWMLAFALRYDGWYLRQDLIWNKPNPMPESVTDRCTKSHEYIFMLAKSNRYYYDAFAIKTPYAEKTFTTFGHDVKGYGDGTGLIAAENRSARINKHTPKDWGKPKVDKQRGHSRRHAGFNDRWDKMSTKEQQEMGANKRSVWTVSTKPFTEAHFATFPEDLITDCIKAGCPEGGTVLDMFSGAGTTPVVSRKLNRNFLAGELNPDYIKISNKRLYQEIGMFL